MFSVNDLTPEVAKLIVDAYTGESKYSIDHMTLIVKSNGYALHDFVYALPGQSKLSAAKPFTWRFIKTQQFKEGDVVSFLCLCEIKSGFKSLTPVAVLELTNDPVHAVNQSRRWNTLLINEGATGLLKGGLNVKETTNTERTASVC